MKRKNAWKSVFQNQNYHQSSIFVTIINSLIDNVILLHSNPIYSVQQSWNLSRSTQLKVYKEEPGLEEGKVTSRLTATLLLVLVADFRPGVLFSEPGVFLGVLTMLEWMNLVLLCVASSCQNETQIQPFDFPTYKGNFSQKIALRLSSQSIWLFFKIK